MLRRAIKKRIRRFGRNADGLAAVEFAFILPAMIVMVFGMVEVSRAVNCRSGIAQLAGTVADLVAQASAPNNSDITNVYRAANTIMYPYYDAAKGNDVNRPTIRITSVIWDTVTKSETIGKVAWSCSQKGTASPLPDLSSTVKLNQNLLTSGGSVVMVEVAYNYVPPSTRGITNTPSIMMKDSFFTKPRRVAQIPSPGCAA